MNTTHSSPNASPAAPAADLTVVVALARLMERLDKQPRAATPEQYRLVAQRLTGAISRLPGGDLLQEVLRTHPAAAELYENLNYENAGLCRAPLEAAAEAELQARDAIRQAQRPSPRAA